MTMGGRCVLTYSTAPNVIEKLVVNYMILGWYVLPNWAADDSVRGGTIGIGKRRHHSTFWLTESFEKSGWEKILRMENQEVMLPTTNSCFVNVDKFTVPRNFEPPYPFRWKWTDVDAESSSHCQTPENFLFFLKNERFLVSDLFPAKNVKNGLTSSNTFRSQCFNGCSSSMRCLRVAPKSNESPHGRNFGQMDRKSPVLIETGIKNVLIRMHWNFKKH